MSKLTWPDKDPDAYKDFALDWSAMLQEGETITDATWSIPADLTASGQTVSGGLAVVWLAGGLAGQSYPCMCQITTSRGMIDQRTVHIKVKEQ